MFAITLPPVVLVLGLLRVGSVGYGALTQPGGSVRATPLRFGGVLVGRFMGPILAIMLVSSHVSRLAARCTFCTPRSACWRCMGCTA